MPVIIGQLLEVAEPGGTHASLLFFPLKDGGQPVRVSDFWRATIKGSSAYLVQIAGFTDGANKFIESESQSTP
ncbi:MAG: hypothetical protein EOS16_35595 [Mesorhizobium sp.]|nr:MAG: hypothetical protein EOS02_35905 [Mesorhizobium sp.]RWO56833.1 MAG: hypothetical protein EOS16_35595 [Mesorhizobium sp.]TIN91650.1 MAG: hypothetical protein E5Y03_36155 [Mesorhizobium sp.]